MESAKGHIRLLNDCGFGDICISLKSSSVPLTVEAYRLASEVLPYPLHLGVTETGTAYQGTVSSAVGIGTCLLYTSISRSASSSSGRMTSSASVPSMSLSSSSFPS